MKEKKTCSIEGCGKNHYAKGLCRQHYNIAIFLLVFSGCNSGYDWTTSQGVHLIWDASYIPRDIYMGWPVPVYQFEQAIEIFATEFPNHLDNLDESKLRETLVNSTIHIQPEMISTKDRGQVYGIQWGNNIRLTWDNNMLHSTALVHELIHLVLRATGSGPDGDHERVGIWWWDDGAENSINEILLENGL